MNRYLLFRVLADGVLLIHFLFVAFVLGGFVLIWMGYFCNWPFVRKFSFRIPHLVAMAIVVAEALLGIVCPLTTWEEQLRSLAGEGGGYRGGFIQHWVGRIMFCHFSETVFTLVYCAFFLLVIITFWKVPPRKAPSPTQ